MARSSHSPTIVPFSVTKYRLKPILHNAAFLGDGPPVFDTRDAAGPTNLLIETPARRWLRRWARRTSC